MALSAGTRLGPYEIVSLLGVGGMGEVYRATDTNLKRQVAIKVLPQTVATDLERLARFQREAEVLAALNHPNIAHIHGLEKSDGAIALVMELVEGPTLADRVAKGAIPLDEAMPIAKQIAEALEAAHEQGIIHRDLKPANIKVREDGTVKVLDFGLAKAMESSGAMAASASMLPTITTPAMTQAGIILGTAAYMSPEQARGKTVDRRADIWAFGCVFYEMLTGRRAFEGETISDVLAKVIERDPDWTTLPGITPVPLRELLRRCLKKDAKARLRDIGDARVQVEELLAGAVDGAPAQVTKPGGRVPIVFGLAVAAAAMGAVVAWSVIRPAPAVPSQPVRFAIVPPTAQALLSTATDRQLAISPDGTRLVYVAGGAGASGTGRQYAGMGGQLTGGQLMVRAIDRLEAEPMRGIIGPRFPFFSPDGRWVGFFQGNQLKKVPIAGGPAITVCRIAGTPRGATWGPDDTIVFATNDLSTGLLGVPAAGGEPKVLTTPDASRGEVDHLFPSVLPGGGAVLFTVTVAGPTDNWHVSAVDLKTGRHTPLVRGGTDAAYVDTGYLVYAAAGTLRAVRFDPIALKVLSDPVALVEQLATMNTGAAEFAVARTGALVYVPGSLGAMAAAQSLVWVNRQGREEATKAPPRAYDQLRLSPDDTRVAIHSSDEDNDIWIWDVARETLTRLTFDPAADMLPLWARDGRRVVFASQRAGVLNLFWQPADGTGAVERLATAAVQQQPNSFSPDGTQLIVREQGAKTGFDLMLLAMDGKGTVVPLVQTTFDENNAEISPDGHWLAYESNESGQNQVYVRPFPNVNGGRWQISTAGGTRPVWARSGRELFYLDGNNFLTTVPVQTTSSFSAGHATKLFEVRPVSAFSNGRSYDVTRDGQRFIVIKNAPARSQTSDETPTSMVVVLHGFEEPKGLMPTK